MLQKIKDKVPSFIRTTLALYALMFSVLTICRLFFYFGFRGSDEAVYNLALILSSFRAGLSFDLVTATYAIYLPLLFLFLNDLFCHKTKFFKVAAFYVSVFIFTLYALVSMADFPYFKQFGSHFNKQAFVWVASPKYVMGLILGDVTYYGYFILFLLLAFAEYKIIRRIVRVKKEDKVVPALHATIALLLFMPVIIFGSRGRISTKSTTHEGMAIVSDNAFINQIALNPNFTFFRSVFFQKIKSYEVPGDIDLSIATARDYLGLDKKYTRSIVREENRDSVFKPYNVIIVCMESMSMYKTGIHGRKNLTPNLNELIKESVLFDRFFSSGIHTYNGLFSTASGFPSLLTEQGLRRYTKKPFVNTGNLLLQKNYETYLAVTHDPVFDNMEGFYKLNGYNKVISSEDLPSSKSLGVTGVPDHELFKLLIAKLNEGPKEKPFLAFVMTGSDHGPWLVPDDIPFKPDANTKEMRSTQYADWSIGELMKEAKKQSWYSNTLFVFLGDHGYAVDGTYDMPLSYHHVPLILHKPNTLKPEVKHNLGYQPDVVSTVAGVLGLKFENHTFGINLMRCGHRFVYFTADDKIGCVSEEGYYYYALLSQNTKRLRRYLDLDQRDYYNEKRSKADSLGASARQMLDAAEYFIRQEYFVY